MDKAKALYYHKLLYEASALPSGNPVSRRCPVMREVLSARKAARFGDSQRRYLDSKSTGVKIDPGDVARNMPYARNQVEKKLFTMSEFLTEQQIQSYFF